MPSQATVTVEATLDADELTFLKEAFKRSKRGDKRITVVHLVKCLEEMDYIIEGDTRDFIRSVVPKAFEADALGLQDAIKVATSAKTQEGAEEEPQIAVLGRDDSLAQLENSFQTQMQSGEIPETVAEGEPPPSPILNRDESLAQLERSFARQLISGDIPEVIVEKEEDAQNGSAVGHAPVVHVDVPRRRSLPGGPSRSWKGMTQRSDTLSVLQQKYPAGQEGPNPEVVDLPHRRSTISVPYIGEGSLVGLDGPLDDQGDSDTSPPTTPELFKQTSEEALLETASDTLGVAPVEISNVPKRRKSLPVSKSWSEAAAKAALAREEAAWIKREEAARVKREEVARAKHEEEARAKVEVTACLAWLTREAQTRFAFTQEKESADRKAAEVLVKLERAKAAYARAEVETVLRLAIESLERGAVISAADAARKEAERKVQEEARIVAAEASARLREQSSAREEAERKTEEAERKAEEALCRVALAEARLKEKEDALSAAFAKAEQREGEIRKEAQEARESQKWETADLFIDEERNYFAESEVSYDTVERSGPWWKCVVCAAPTDLNEGNGRGHPSEIQRFDGGRENGEDYAAAVESIKPEMWIKSSGATSSTRSIRPDSSDVCSVM